MNLIDIELVKRLSSDIDVLQQLIKTTGAISKFNGVSAIIPNKKMLINTLGIQESRSSNAIENIFTTNSDVFESMALNVDIGSSKEVLNYNFALTSANEYIKNRPITQSLLIDIQGIVEPNKKGIRKNQVHIGNPKTGEIVHVPPKTNEVEGLLSDLIKFINIDCDETKINPLINIIVTHFQFESIHPFLDGNGRTGRILIITQLLNYGYLDEPILYLSRYINETRDEYYKHLRMIGNVNKYENWKDFVIYYLKGMEVISNQSIKLVKNIEKLIEKTKEELLGAKFKRNTDVRLIELLFTHPYFDREIYEDTLGVKKVTAVSDLNILIDKKIIKREKKFTSTYYINIKLYELLENGNKK